MAKHGVDIDLASGQHLVLIQEPSRHDALPAGGLLVVAVHDKGIWKHHELEPRGVEVCHVDDLVLQSPGGQWHASAIKNNYTHSSRTHNRKQTSGWMQ